MSDNKVNQDSSMIRVRINEQINKSFRVALAINNETMQDVLSRAVLQYIKDTKLPDDLLIK